jgi:hypothetical protein
LESDVDKNELQLSLALDLYLPQMWSFVATFQILFRLPFVRLELYPSASMRVATVPYEAIRVFFAHLIRVNYSMAVFVMISPEVAVKIDLQHALSKLGD